jgi:hypothetical protein
MSIFIELVEIIKDASSKLEGVLIYEYDTPFFEFLKEEKNIKKILNFFTNINHKYYDYNNNNYYYYILIG